MSIDYRLYPLNSDGKIAAAAELIEAAGDEEAIQLVRLRDADHCCELWDGDRLVARIEPRRLSA